MTLSGKEVICDTGILSRYAVEAAEILQTINFRIGIENVYISPVIRIELCNWLSGYHSLTKPHRAILLSFIKDLKLLHLTEDISKLAVGLSDKNINAKPADTLIAATALHHNIPVYTLNKKDFRQLGAKLYE